MNGIIALCHFCEIHGPSVLFCTQALHCHDPQPSLGAEANFPFNGSPWSERRAVSAPVTPSTPTLPSHTVAKISDMCEACRSMPPGQPGYISTDHEAKVSYVSSQHPQHPQVFTMVRQACLRSLSCEVSPGREGPIFFGDDNQGHVLSHTFFVKDSQARGLQRWYSIIVVMMDKIYLLNSWPFLVEQFKGIVDKIQTQALAVYESEYEKCPPRAHRLMMSMTPSNFRMQRGGVKSARSLVELTNDKQVFIRLHRSFTRVLKLGGSRLTERLLEGPPTEDSIIDLEKQEETEEGFVKLYSKKLSVDDDEEIHCGEGVIETPAEERDPRRPTFKNLRHVLKVLGDDIFHNIAHHVVIGNQVIVRGREKRLVCSLIDCLKVLLPRGCCRLIHYSHKYEDSWKCNFLGLSPGTELPEHATLFVTLDIEEPPQMAEDEFVPPGVYDLENYSFKVNTLMQMPVKAPTVLTKMEAALKNEKLADSVVEHCLICLKEEWMNKVKVLFKFTKAGGNRSEEDTQKLMQVVSAQEEDKSVLKFWMTGLSVQYRNHMLSSAIQQSVNN